MVAELRPHQLDAVAALRGSLASGRLRPILAAPCSFGKTAIACHILMSAAKKGKTGIFFVDRLKLLVQTEETFKRLGADYTVIQADRPFDPTKKIQIASVQTAINRELRFDVGIVDECHVQYKGLLDIMHRWNAIPFIGMSATPYSKNLGLTYDDLIVTKKPRDLMEEGWLCPVEYYAGKRLDTKGIKTKALSTGGSDYDPEELGQKMLEDDTLAGDIIENYRKHSKGLTRRGIAFAPNITYSKNLVERFNEAQIPACHIDGYTPDEERELIYQDFEDGVYKVLSCSKLLATGYDSPSTEILIDCFPTKSLINFVQRAGRIMRIHPDKEIATYLDHAGNLEEHGQFPEDVIPSELDEGKQNFKEREQVEKPEVELKMQECPVCYSQFQGRTCGACGYQLPPKAEILKDDGKELVKVNKLTNKEDKQVFLSGLIRFGLNRGYKHGWASWKYKEKFGVWPRGLEKVASDEVPEEVRGYIQHMNIKNAKRREHELR